MFRGKRYSQETGAAEVTVFFTQLAVTTTSSPSTQNQAEVALLFLYRQVLGANLLWLDEMIRAEARQLLPVVLTRGKVR